ncbi:GrpB family protein [Streptomyces sp. NPDC050732]|uniref:GrpB family protein n=1 Tax=Streptomyces sp. NPDC050732 TaxID=3154632 RepID=UPI003448D8DD
MTDRIVVSAYEPQWSERFEDRRQWLAPHVADLAVSIEHIGSTAVPGCAAKPIIDLDIVVPEEAAMLVLISRLAGQGYQHEGDLGIQGREAFRAPPAAFEHHLYGVVAGTKPHLDHVLLGLGHGALPRRAGEASVSPAEGGPARTYTQSASGSASTRSPSRRCRTACEP